MIRRTGIRMWIETQVVMSEKQQWCERLFSPIPEWVTWLYCFGGLTLLVFLLQVLSGIYLAMFFQPSPGEAWASIEFIEKNIFLGKFARSLHRWGAFLMVLFLLAHVFRTLLHGAFRAPRQLNWLSGVMLLLLTAAFAVTGYLLPWDFRAYWAVKTMGNWIEALPLFSGATDWLLHGDTLNGIVPVGRWFVIHTLVLPAAACAFLTVHFFMVRKLGVAEPM
jgi:quinol-cytochrome oxidoreductase complex cytochrome b subunit